MGSSTRNSYDRSQRVINQELERGNIKPNAEGIAKLLVKLIFPDRGTSKVKITLQKNLCSEEYSNGIVKLSKLHTAAKEGNLGGIGFGGIAGLSNIELKEKICDYIGINDNEILKTSFNETMDKIDILDPISDFISFLSEFTKNITSNIFKQYTYEDALNELEGFDTEIYNKDIELYMNEEIEPIINIEMQQLNFEELEKEKNEKTIFQKVSNTISRILNKLRRKKE